MGSRGDNKQSYALYEELKHLRVAPEAGTPRSQEASAIASSVSVASAAARAAAYAWFRSGVSRRDKLDL